MKEFKKFADDVRKCRKECPWEKTQTFETMANFAFEEAREVKEAVEKKDYKNLKEEIGDTFWLLTCLISIAEEKGLFSADDVIKDVHEKMHRRKPWVFNDDITAETAEDAIKIWYERKEREKK